MPFPVSIPMAAAFFGLFYLMVGMLLRAPQWVEPLMSGSLSGTWFTIYALCHPSSPHALGYAKYIKRYHMQHHYKDPDTRYGVSSPVWDRVFGTQGAAPQ